MIDDLWDEISVNKSNPKRRWDEDARMIRVPFSLIQNLKTKFESIQADRQIGLLIVLRGQTVRTSGFCTCICR
jgi:hypothetical protein